VIREIYTTLVESARANKVSQIAAVTPECFIGGPVSKSSGFPLKACGNDRRWISRSAWQAAEMQPANDREAGSSRLAAH